MSYILSSAFVGWYISDGKQSVRLLEPKGQHKFGDSFFPLADSSCICRPWRTVGTILEGKKERRKIVKQSYQEFT